MRIHKTPKKPIFFNRYIMKSFIELYFSYYLDELLAEGYIDKWEYEVSTFKLSEGYSRSYQKKLVTKVKESTEHILREASLTADFTIYWTIKAENLFYLNPRKPITTNVGDIPFRLGYEDERLISFVETKGNVETTVSSSISFPYKAKWALQLHGAFVQKIKPFSYKAGKSILFYNTFTPIKVLSNEIYKRDSKWGTQGTSKLKFTPRTLTEYIKDKYKII